MAVQKPNVIAIEPATPSNSGELAAILNAIIERGGTTALQRTLTPDEFAAAFLSGERHLLCLVARHLSDGAALGFQHLERHPDLPSDWADIATFARIAPRVPGVGRELLARTVENARGLVVRTINATIRADNAPGLGYYEAMGFRTYRTVRAVPLADGTPVDRVSKSLTIGSSGERA